MLSQSRSTEVYNFIYDSEQVKKFARLIGTENHLHLTFLCSRPKYDRRFKQNVISPKSFYNKTADEFLELVRRYEVEYQTYTEKDIPIPSSALVLYSTTNPRNGRKAGKKLITELIDATFNDTDMFQHLQSRLTSAIMSSKETTNLLTIDIDDKNEYGPVQAFLQAEEIPVVATVETRGGYHILFSPNYKTKIVYDHLSSKHTIGDTFCPIPGTIQGGFPVRFI